MPTPQRTGGGREFFEGYRQAILLHEHGKDPAGQVAGVRHRIFQQLLNFPGAPFVMMPFSLEIIRKRSGGVADGGKFLAQAIV